MSHANTRMTMDEGRPFFPSLAALRAMHSDLLKRLPDDGRTPAFVADVADFIRRGRATGALLQADDDRWAGQSLLDYWANCLDRLGHEMPDSTLAPFDPALSPDLPDAACPYVGLRAYGDDDRHRFFGREALIGQMVDRLKETSLLAIAGPASSGKSSALLAGLIPELKGGALPRSYGWRYYPPLAPGADPLAKLARLFQPRGEEAGMWIGTQVERLQQRPDHLAHLLREDTAGPSVLVVDQFEELFTLCIDEQARQAFANNLDAVLEAADTRCIVILGVRSDFAPDVRRLPALAPHFDSALLRLTPLAARELRAAIEGPAELVGLQFAEGVVDKLIQEFHDDPAGLPLLQFTLLRLWEKRQHTWVTKDAYFDLGGAVRALTDTADRLYDELPEEDKETLRRLLLQLIRPGEAGRIVRMRVRREELYQIHAPPAAIDRVANALIAARLVRLTTGDTPADDRVEVAHEALPHKWTRLVDWLARAQQTMRLRAQLTAAAVGWQAHRWDPNLLWRGPLLADAQRLEDLGELDAAFLQASQEAIENTQRAREFALVLQLKQAQDLSTEKERLAEVERQRAEEQTRAATLLRWRLRWLVAMLIVAVVVGALAIVATVWAVQQKQIADQARKVAVTQRQVAVSHDLAASAAAQLQTDPQVSVLLATRAVTVSSGLPVTDTLQAEDALRQALLESHVRAVMRGHTGALRAASFSPNGQLIVTASDDGTARVWAAHTGRLVATLRGHTAAVNSAAFSPDSRYVVTASDDGTARLWSARTGAVVAVLSGGGGAGQTGTSGPAGAFVPPGPSGGYSPGGPLPAAVLNAAFSPDGRYVVTASAGDTVRIWVARTGRPVATLRGHIAAVNSAAFSPDGRLVVTASADDTARLWAAPSGRPVATLRGHTGPVQSAAFSPDGRYVVTASADDTARVWSPSTHAVVSVLSDGGVAVNGAAFSPDGRYVVTANGDGAARLWVAGTGRLVTVLSGHTGPVQRAAFSPDGRYVVTASDDGTARLWGAPTGRLVATLRGHTAAVNSAAFSPDSRYVVTASDDGTARLWAAPASAPVVILLGHSAQVNSAAFSPDGRYVVTASNDDTARVWRAGLGNLAATLRGHRDYVHRAAFSPDGRYVVTASDDGTARLWSARTGRLVAVLDGAGQTGTRGPVDAFVLPGSSGGHGPGGASPPVHVDSAAFSPDGRLVVTASTDGTARLWAAPAGHLVAVLRGHTAAVNSAAFSPDSRYVVTASADGTARIWVTRTHAVIHVLRGYQSDFGAAFSPDGRLVVIASANSIAQVWSARTGHLVATLQGHTGPVYTATFSPDGRYVVTASDDGTARLWSARTGAVVAVFSGHTGAVQSAAFSPDGQYVVTAGHDGTARVWVARTGVPVLVLSGHAASVNSAAFSPGGQLIVTASDDGTGQLYACDVCGARDQLLSLARQRTQGQVTPEEWTHYSLLTKGT